MLRQKILDILWDYSFMYEDPYVNSPRDTTYNKMKNLLESIPTDEKFALESLDQLKKLSITLNVKHNCQILKEYFEARKERLS